MTIGRVAHAVARVTNPTLEEAEDSASQIDGITLTSGDGAYSFTGTVSIASCREYCKVTLIDRLRKGGREGGREVRERGREGR